MNSSQGQDWCDACNGRLWGCNTNTSAWLRWLNVNTVWLKLTQRKLPTIAKDLVRKWRSFPPGGTVYHDYEHVLVSNTCLQVEGFISKLNIYLHQWSHSHRLLTVYNMIHDHYTLFWSETPQVFTSSFYKNSKQTVLKPWLHIGQLQPIWDEDELRWQCTVDNQPWADWGEGRG